MTDTNSTVDTLITRENELTSAKGKVAPFAYTQTAYDANTYEGVDSYAYAQEQNIPNGTATILTTNETVLSKGIRAQASSLSRMLVNHFFGRTSYNLNKIHDFFKTFLKAFKKHLAQDCNLYSSTNTYYKDDICFILDTLNSQKTIRIFRCISTATAGIKNKPPIVNGAVATSYWTECISSMQAVISLTQSQYNDLTEADKTNPYKMYRITDSSAYNITNEITASSTDDQIPTALAVYAMASGNAMTVDNLYTESPSLRPGKQSETYIKFGNGIAFIYGWIEITVDLVVPWGSLYESEEVEVGLYLHDIFVEEPRKTFSRSSARSHSGWWLEVSTDTKQDPSKGIGQCIFCRATQASDVPVRIAYTALGRWK